MLPNSCKVLLAIIFLAAFSPAPAIAAPPERPALTSSLQKIVDDYLANRAKVEGFTGISASVSLPGDNEPPIDVVAGRVSKAANAQPVTPATLFQIGSITKSMTSTVILQLVHEGVLSLDAPIGPWLPEYPAWGSVTLRRLLDMTSGIPATTRPMHSSTPFRNTESTVNSPPKSCFLSPTQTFPAPRSQPPATIIQTSTTSSPR